MPRRPCPRRPWRRGLPTTPTSRTGLSGRGRGRLIAFEGGEGAGKSTQAQRLATALGAELTREPGGTALGDRIRQLLLQPEPDQTEGAVVASAMTARAELMLMLAARAQHVAERIRPALEAGRDVVVDRFSGSTLAYQGYGRGLPLGAVTDACDLATGELWPDLTILLDVPFEMGWRRRSQTGTAPDRIESEDEGFHARVAEGFRTVAAADRHRWFVIDGTGEVEDVAQLVRQAVAEMLDGGGRR